MLALGVVLVALLGACVPTLSPIYVPEVSTASLVFSSCPFNSHVPVGAAVRLGSVSAFVSLSTHEERPFVEIRFEVPAGHEIRLESDSLSVESGSTGATAAFSFPAVSLVDTPIVNSYSKLPVLRAQQLPATALLVGGTVHAGSRQSGRNFWLAAYIETGDAPSLVVTLPRLSIDAVAQEGPRIGFRRKLMPVVALMNC